MASQWHGTVFWTEGGAKYIIHFDPKLPSMCINQKCSIGVGSLHIF